MTSPSEEEWTILNPTILSTIGMGTTYDPSSKANVPAHESFISANIDTDAKKTHNDCTCEAKPMLVRTDSIESIHDDYRRPRRASRVLPPPHRRFSPSPQRYQPLPIPLSYTEPMINSSIQLLERVGKEDGVIELPNPAIRNVYLNTYPFGDKDVKKWSWLLASGIEDEYVIQSTRDMNGDMPSIERIRHDRGEFHIRGPRGSDIASVHLSCALDTEVVPEDSKHNLRYLIVTQHHCRPQGWKLLVAESRKAAGVLIYYEMLKGESVLFVGATVHQCKNFHPREYKKVNSLEEVLSAQEEGLVGIVC